MAYINENFITIKFTKVNKKINIKPLIMQARMFTEVLKKILIKQKRNSF